MARAQLSLLVFAAALAIAAPRLALAQADFYRGKQIRLISGHPVGGDYDLGARFLAKHQKVILNGTGGVGGAMIANLLQSSIDRRLNPIEIMRLDKLSFAIPIQK